MELVWIMGAMALVALFMYVKQSKKEAKKERNESEDAIQVNNKGCSIVFYAFLLGLLIFFVYSYIKYRQSLG